MHCDKPKFWSRYAAPLFAGFILTSCILIATIGERGRSRQRMTREEIYNKAARAADSDGDGITTQDEWGRAYKKIGLHYDATRAPYDTLTTEQLEAIVSSDKVASDNSGRLENK